MTPTVEAVTTVPQWFTTAIETIPRTGEVVVREARIRYRSWGTAGERNVVLVHGGAAHSRWWDHIAPLLATTNRVVALDLSGHGDSDHRTTYDVPTWAEEIVAVAEANGFEPGYTVVGHSLGGLVTLELAKRAPSPVREAIVIDSPIGVFGSKVPVEAQGLSEVKRKFYPSAAETIARFRPVPAQESLAFVSDYIAAASVVETPEGWSWKFDSTILAGGHLLAAQFTAMDARLAYFRAEYGVVSASVRAVVERAGASFVELPQAGHAPMLDQPLALVTGIRTAFAAWNAENARAAAAATTAAAAAADE
ncbi:MAG: putative alpha/beta hydrolase [Frankiales bacterium]|nr:putative alpha/beta hydrolase [Frankiales bacterium]